MKTKGSENLMKGISTDFQRQDHDVYGKLVYAGNFLNWATQ